MLHIRFYVRKLVSRRSREFFGRELSLLGVILLFFAISLNIELFKMDPLHRHFHFRYQIPHSTSVPSSNFTINLPPSNTVIFSTKAKYISKSNSSITAASATIPHKLLRLISYQRIIALNAFLPLSNKILLISNHNIKCTHKCLV